MKDMLTARLNYFLEQSHGDGMNTTDRSKEIKNRELPKRQKKKTSYYLKEGGDSGIVTRADTVCRTNKVSIPNEI
jgi:hypothetical protein